MDGTIQIGEILDGKYEILEFLGAGGVGSVYKAKQVDTQRLVAIKVLHQAAYLDDEFKARFLREGKALSQLEHKAIVRVFHLSISSRGLLYLVMEYISGRSLRQYLNEEGSIEPAKALAITQELAWALAHVHKLGLVHRDLKPENLLLDETQAEIQPKIVDFGLARIVGAAAEGQKLTRTGMLIGTCAYMSPEQCRAEAVSFSSDIYSLAVCLYEFLCGRRPFDADTPIGIMYKHIHEEAAPLKVFNERSLDDKLGKILKRAMAKAPSDRYQSVEEFAAALSNFSDSLEGGSQASGLKKYGAVLAALVLLILVSAGFTLLPRLSKPYVAGSSKLAKVDKSNLSALSKLSFKAQMRHLQKLKVSGQSKEAASAAYFLIEKQKLKPAEKVELLFFHASCLPDLAAAADYAEILQAAGTGSNQTSDSIACQSLCNLSALALRRGMPQSALRLLDKLELRACSLGNDKMVSAYFSPDTLSYGRIRKANILLQIGRTEQARKIFAEELYRVSSPAIKLVELAVSLKELQKFENCLESGINSPESLVFAANYCLGAGLTSQADRILNFVSSLVEQYAHSALQGPDLGQRSSRGIHTYLSTLLSVSRAKVLEETNKHDQAIALLLKTNSQDLSEIEKEKLLQLKGDISLLLMFLGKEKQAWAMQEMKSRIAKIPDDAELHALLSGLNENKQPAFKKARELLACPELPPDFRIAIARKALAQSEPDLAFHCCAAYNDLLHKQISDPLLEYECYKLLAGSLRARNLSRAAVSVLSSSKSIVQRKFKNDDEKKKAEIAYTECVWLKAQILYGLGEREAALSLWKEFDNGKLADYLLFETALDFKKEPRAWQMLDSSRSIELSVQIALSCLKRGLDRQASLACRKARAGLPKTKTLADAEVFYWENAVLIEQGNLKEAAARLSGFDCRILEQLKPEKQAENYERLMLLSALAESPDTAKTYYKRLLECRKEI